MDQLHKKLKEKDLYKGGIALPTVIILTGILILTGTTLVLSSIDLRKSSKNNQYRISAQIGINNCLEESIQRLKYNPDFTGLLTVPISSGECSATVTDSLQPGFKEVELTATSGDVYITDEYIVNITTYPFEVE